MISDQEIQEAILKHPGPFVTPKRIYRKFSSRTRPDGDNVRSQMLHLEGVGLGTARYDQSIKTDIGKPFDKSISIDNF